MTTRAEEIEKTIQFNEHTAIVTRSGRDALLILCEPNTKEPLRRFVQNVTTPRVEIYALAQKDKTLNVGHALTTEQLDFDFDAANPVIMEAFKYFLPFTPYKFGRDSKPDSHWIYCLTDDYYLRSEEFKYVEIFLRETFKIADFKAKIEFRYRTHPDNDFTQRDIAQNPYILAPGSIHPEHKELIKWQDSFDIKFTPVRHDVQFLIKRAILATIASLIAPHWISGNRQYMCMALAGSLFKFANVKQSTVLDYKSKSIKKVLEEVEEQDFIQFTEQDFEYLIEGICKITNDDEVSTRIQAFKQTWRKAEHQDKKITGLPTLKRFLGQEASYIQEAMFHLISGITSEIDIQKLTERFVIHIGPGNVIDLDRMDPRNQWIMTRKQFTDSYADKSVWWQGKPATLANFVYRSGVIPKVDGIDFRPPERLSIEDYDAVEDFNKFIDNGEFVYVNTFKRYAVAPSKEPVNEEDVKPFLDYVKEVFCCDKPERFEYMIAFMANLIQTPALRPRTYLIIVGEQGAGKSFLFENVLGPILGRHNTLFNDKAEDLFGRFNAPLANKMLVVFEEAISSNRKEIAQRIKHFISGSTITLEMKRIDAIEISNYARAVFISNNETNAVTLDFTDKERRAVVFKVSSKYCGNLEYFKKLYDFTQANLDKIHRFLLNYKIEDPDILNRPFFTEEKVELQSSSIDYDYPELSWILDRLEDGFPISEETHKDWFEAFNYEDMEELSDTLRLDRTKWPDTVSAKALRQDMDYYFRMNGVPVNRRNDYKRRLKNILPYLTPRSRMRLNKPSGAMVNVSMPRLYSMPRKDEVIQFLRNKYGQLIEAKLAEIEQEGDEVIDFTKKEVNI